MVDTDKERIKEIEEIFKDASKGAKEIIYNLSVKLELETMNLDALIEKREWVQKTDNLIGNLMLEYVALSRKISNGDYETYCSCYGAITRMLEGRINNRVKGKKKF